MDAVDPDRLKLYSFVLFSKLEGALTAAMVHLGDRLGLYRAMTATAEPATSSALAERAGLDERWVREWLFNQSAAGLVDHDGDRFWLSPEATAVLTQPNHPAYGMGQFSTFPKRIGMLDDIATSFRTGVGLPYDAFGPEGAAGIEASFAPWYANFLVPVALPLLDGVLPALEAGAAVADVGCGAGVAVLTMAKAFPASHFTGYDISEHALIRARESTADAGHLTNVQFHDPRRQPLPADHSLRLVTTFDCIHDMTHPFDAMVAIRQALADDGTWLLVDIKARDSFDENVEKNPMASLMYAMSIVSCMSSALSEPGGAGLGTLGLPESKARAMAADAGFTRFRKLAIEHAINAFYEIRP